MGTGLRQHAGGLGTEPAQKLDKRKFVMEFCRIGDTRLRSFMDNRTHFRRQSLMDLGNGQGVAMRLDKIQGPKHTRQMITIVLCACQALYRH